MQSECFSFAEGHGYYVIQLNGIEIGADLVITVCGGEKPHVGAVAIGIPRQSLSDGKKVSSSVSVFTMTGHKEDELAKMMAGKLTAALNRVTIITAGIHIDDIDPEGIKVIEDNVSKILDKVLQYFRQRNSN